MFFFQHENTEKFMQEIMFQSQNELVQENRALILIRFTAS